MRTSGTQGPTCAQGPAAICSMTRPRSNFSCVTRFLLPTAPAVDGASTPSAKVAAIPGIRWARGRFLARAPAISGIAPSVAAKADERDGAGGRSAKVSATYERHRHLGRPSQAPFARNRGHGRIQSQALAPRWPKTGHRSGNAGYWALHGRTAAKRAHSLWLAERGTRPTALGIETAQPGGSTASTRR